MIKQWDIFENKNGTIKIRNQCELWNFSLGSLKAILLFIKISSYTDFFTFQNNYLMFYCGLIVVCVVLNYNNK